MFFEKSRDKSKFIILTRKRYTNVPLKILDGYNLNISEFVKYLGIVLDSKEIT